jgi:hypothetical protein
MVLWTTQEKWSYVTTLFCEPAMIMQTSFYKNIIGPGTGAHAYNHIYSGGRDQEDCSSKSAQANNS